MSLTDGYSSLVILIINIKFVTWVLDNLEAYMKADGKFKEIHASECKFEKISQHPVILKLKSKLIRNN